MEIYLPTLESKIIALVSAFRFLVFAIMVAGLIAGVVTHRFQHLNLLSLIARATLIVGAIAYQDTWFPKVEQVFVSVADYINPGFSAHPTAGADKIRQSTAQNPDGNDWSWRKLSESVYQSFVSALATVFVYLGTLVSVPMLILQYILKWLLYLITPFALAILLVPNLSGIGVRFFQQLLAILAWPIGFALTDLVALAIWKDFMAAVNPSSTGTEIIVYAPLLTLMGAIMATIMIIIGTISTPVVMQMLFAQGHAFSGASVSSVGMVRNSANFVAAHHRSQGSTPRGSQTSLALVNPSPSPVAERPSI